MVRTETRLDGVVKRRSLCAKCGHLWTTWDGSLTPPPVTRGRTSPYTEQVLQYLEAGAQQTRIALGLQIPIHVVRHIARKHKHERP